MALENIRINANKLDLSALSAAYWLGRQIGDPASNPLSLTEKRDSIVRQAERVDSVDSSEARQVYP